MTMWDQETKISAEDQQALKQVLDAVKGGDVGAFGKLLQHPKALVLLGRLLAPTVDDLVKRLGDMGLARHRAELYDAIARPLARSIGCEQDEMAAWILLNAEPTAPADIAQRQAAGRAATRLGERTILLEVSYGRVAAGRFTELTRAWLISAAGAVEHTSERVVSLDSLPDAARSALVSGERDVTFKLIK